MTSPCSGKKRSFCQCVWHLVCVFIVSTHICRDWDTVVAVTKGKLWGCLGTWFQSLTAYSECLPNLVV